MKTYTTKLAIGDTAWFMLDNKAASMTVESIEIKKTKDVEFDKIHEWTGYGFRKYSGNGDFQKWIDLNESEVFATKEELLASL